MEIRCETETIKYRLRTEAGLTIRELARKLGRNQSTVSLVITGRRKSAPIIAEIAALLGEDPEELASALARQEGDTTMT